MKGQSLFWALILCGQSLLAQFSTDAVFSKGDSIVYYTAETGEERLIYRQFVDDIAVDFDADRLYLRTPNIVISDLFGENVDTISFSNGGLFSLDGDNTVYFSDDVNTNILRLNSEDQSTSIVLNVGSTSITGSTIIDFEIDKSNSQRLFLARQEPEEIQIWDIGSEQKTGSFPVSGLSVIAVVPETNQLFHIANIETDSVKIRVSDLNGDNLKELISDGLDHPFSLDVNLAEQKIYWAENGQSLSGLYRANLDGTEIEKVSDDILRHIVFAVPEMVNETPVVTSPVSDMNVPFGFASFQIDLDTVFNDPDGDVLSYSSDLSETGIVEAIINGSVLTVTGNNAVGEVTLTINARDDKNGSVSDEFMITVSERVNEAPVVTRSIPDMVLIEGYEQFQIDLDTIFEDDHTADLFYLASGNPTSVVRFEADNNILTVIEVGTGTTTITISADDKEGGKTEISFMLTVEGVLSTDQFLSNAFLLYPNPVQDHVNVITREKPTLITLAGQRLSLRMQQTERGWQIDLSKLSPGAYILRIEGAPYRIIKTD